MTRKTKEQQKVEKAAQTGTLRALRPLAAEAVGLPGGTPRVERGDLFTPADGFDASGLVSAGLAETV